jgi:hypothetical protein
MILILDFQGLDLDRESYFNSTWSRAIDRILQGVLIGPRLWLLIQISLDEIDI